MGCVFSTPATDDRRNPDGDHHRRRWSTEEPPVTDGVNAVRPKEAAEKGRQINTRYTDDFQAADRRKPRLDPYPKNQQGWPTWLVEFAGDAIKDWTPRRASTFEKLSKVLKKPKLDIIFVVKRPEFKSQFFPSSI